MHFFSKVYLIHFKTQVTMIMWPAAVAEALPVVLLPPEILNPLQKSKLRAKSATIENFSLLRLIHKSGSLLKSHSHSQLLQEYLSWTHNRTRKQFVTKHRLKKHIRNQWRRRTEQVIISGDLWIPHCLFSKKINLWKQMQASYCTLANRRRHYCICSSKWMHLKQFFWCCLFSFMSQQ